ncbi:DUF3574 domain-containing protein [Celerinatantimonas sp. MCCC 1A17872]|uniref:DUF3574 domain-containing protein n=1 Tax=Celerinatantimonas sp. MCCC 1A17872 TaxID=3177514 RepID=UPI0038BF9EB9
MQMNQFITRRHLVGGLVLSFTLALSGCALEKPAPKTSDVHACQVGSVMAQSTLYFGMSRTDGPNITQAQWQSFVNNEVTPRFRDGLTVFRARGQWLGEDGKIAREPSRALLLIYPRDDKASNAKIEKIRKIYMQQFHQESVMRVDSSSCVSF